MAFSCQLLRWVDISCNQIALSGNILNGSINHLFCGRVSNTFTLLYERTLQTVCDVALSELSDDAENLLEILAFLNPDEIPEAMVVDGCKEQSLISLKLEDMDQQVPHSLRHHLRSYVSS